MVLTPGGRSLHTMPPLTAQSVLNHRENCPGVVCLNVELIKEESQGRIQGAQGVGHQIV